MEQQPEWPDQGRVEQVRRALATRPALVPEHEVKALRTALGAVARREALVLQAGDCAELFSQSSGEALARRLFQLDGLAEALRRRLGVPVVAVGRIAGQYAKPRTSPWEAAASGTMIPSYRGDAVNDARPDPAGRVPDPTRLAEAYDHSMASLRQIRRFCTERDPARQIFTSHELLLLDYEIPLTRKGEDGLYLTSAHTGWIGERTRGMDSAHIAYAETFENPVGVKIGPTVSPDETVELSLRLNPLGDPGRLTFIVRMGADRVAQALPPVVSAVARHGAPVIWQCDPMHANTFIAPDGDKCRAVSDVDAEVADFVRILRAHRQWPAGVHLEVTPDDVTECVATRQDAAARPRRYRSACDPRLNPEQATDVIDRFAGRL